MAVSEAKKRANAKYNAKAYDRIELKVKKGTKEKIEKAAKNAGCSMSAYIKASIQQRLKNETNESIDF